MSSDTIKIEVPPLEVRKLAISSFVVFLVFACFFVLFRSQDLLGVDGAFRCLEVYHKQVLFFHGSNHMLYPVNVLLWTRAADYLGFHASDPLSFYSVVELMNCFAAAGCLTIFFLLTYAASRSWGLATVVTAAFGLSKAFLIHATNASEPMVGIFWSFLAVAAAALSFRRSSLWPAFFSGFLLALAMATYQSAVLLGPAALYLIWQSRPHTNHSTLLSSRVHAVLVFGLGASLGCASIYGSYALWQRKHLPHGGGDMLGYVASQIFEHPYARTYFGVGLGKFATVPVGLVRNVFPIFNDYRGLLGVLRGPVLPVLGLALLLLVVACLMAFCAGRLYKIWGSLARGSRDAILSALLGLVFSLFLVVTWSDQYDKLWLQPLASLYFLLGISLYWISRRLVRPFLLTRALPALVLVGVLTNLGLLRAQHLRVAPEIREAQRLAAMMRSNDLLVGEWDAVSVLYGYGWAADGQLFSFPSEASEFGPTTTSHLRDAILKTQSSGGRVFFLSLLDLPRDSWDPFLASRCGVPYSDLDLYRARSVTRATFATRSHEIALKEFIGAP